MSGETGTAPCATPRSVDAARIEEAGLNALQTAQQLFYDGWLLRLSPGKAKRGRSINPHFGSSLPLARKIGHCERLYAQCSLPVLFRITPFRKPADLDESLARRGYVAFDNTLVQTLDLTRPHGASTRGDIGIARVPAGEFVAAAAALRGSTPTQQAAHRERLALSPLDSHLFVVRDGEEAIACGQLTCDGDVAAIYDMVTAPKRRGRGLASALVGALLAQAQRLGMRVAFLQVNDDNAPALAVYRKFGFTTAYAYHYRGREGECR